MTRDPTATLLAATRRRLIVITLLLVTLLVLGMGAATAVVGLGALDADVDRSLEASVQKTVTALDGELPQEQEGQETDETVPSAADTFVFVLDATGREVANASRVALTGLPDRAALAAVRSAARDLRTVTAAGVDVRLLTEPITSSGGQRIGFVQAGFVLTLHDRQSRSLVIAIAMVGLVGLGGAAIVTLLVTGDALVPIRRSFAAQRRFVADASHELKTPPSIIRANAEVLEREGLVLEGGLPLVADIVTETDRLSRLVGDLLQLAAADATGLALVRRAVDVRAVAGDTVRQAQALAAERGVALAIDQGTLGSAPPAVVSGDPDRLTQLVVILIDNAIDHAPTGTAVEVGVRTSGGQVGLTVADHGPGVPVAERSRVFEPFTRLPGVRRDGAGGTGLGLAIARRIVIAHEGTIAVDEAPGGGARFVVSLPGTRVGSRPT